MRSVDYMKGIKKPDINERSQIILRAVVDIYLEGAEPVGSRSVAKKTDLGVSPATIRNVMADLEDIGLLYQPHTSAGRLPTEKGLRFYVNHLLERKGLTPQEKEVIKNELEGIGEDVGRLIKRAVGVLAKISGQAALAMAPSIPQSELLHVELVKLNPSKILVVSIYSSGLAQTRHVRLRQDIDEERLRRINDYLNEKIKYMSIKEVRRAIVQEMQEDKRLFDSLMEEALDKAESVSSVSPEEMIFVGGAVNLLNQPEFKNINRLKQILRAFEDKKTLVEILEAAGDGDSVTIIIGEKELTTFIPGCGAVVATYEEDQGVRGSLGILGPMRMDYGKIMSLVEYTAGVLSTRIKES